MCHDRRGGSRCIAVFMQCEKTKAAIIIEVILAAALIVAVMLVLRINSLTGAIGRTTQYEAVQIVTLKDSEIEPEDDLSDQVLGYANDDEGAYEKSSEILVEMINRSKRVILTPTLAPCTASSWPAMLR